jgi:hypothetical protein
MRLKSVSRPDAPHEDGLIPTALAIAGALQWVASWGGAWLGQRDDPIDGLGRQRRNPRGPGLVAGQPRDPLVHEALLPAPDHGFALADGLGDGVGALAIRRQQDNPSAPDVLLWTVAIPARSRPIAPDQPV